MFDFLKKLFSTPYQQIDAKEYAATYFNKNNHQLIDVRTPGEFKSGHIAGAKNIPLNELASKLKQVPNNKPVVVVCQSGSRSGSACRILLDAGYTNMLNLKGGTMAWRMNGKPVQ